VTLLPGEGWDNVNFGNRLDAGGVPATSDLLATSDTGSSNSDDLTKLNNANAAGVLQFHVPNTIPGAEVQLYVEGVGTTFGAQTDIVEGNSSWTHAADLDGDGDIDILRASQTGNQISWLENLDGQGTFGPEQIITTIAAQAKSVYAADLDGDGDLDVMSASPADGKFAWYENTDGQGTFGPQQVIGATQQWAPYSMAAADFDGDGDLDVLGGTRFNTLRWYENLDGLGTFSSRIVIDPISDAEFASAVFAEDLDGDGDTDVLAVRANTGELLWYRNEDGLGTFSAPIVIASDMAGIRTVRAADLDADGDLDVVAGGWNLGQLHWFENVDGQGAFSVRHIVVDDGNVGGRVPSLDATDFDGDGDLDLVAAHGHNIDWYANDGAGNFGPRQIVAVSAINPNAVTTADVNGDGRPDVVATINSSGISWFENKSIDALIGSATATGWRTLVTTDGSTSLADGVHRIKASQQESGGPELFSAASLSITVDTESPTVTVDSLETETTSPQLTGAVNDPAATVEIHVYGVGPLTATNVGDGTWQLPSGSITPQLPPGQYDVQVTAIDVAGNAGTDSTVNELTILPPSNVAPVADAGGVYAINEGDSVVLDASGSSDADDGQSLFYTWTVYGIALPTTTSSTLALSWSDLQALGIDDAPGLPAGASFTVTVRVDDDGTPSLSDTDTTTLNLSNTAPVATLSNSGPVDEGATGSVTFADASDPSAGDTAAGFTYSFDFDNDGVFEIIDAATATAVVPASYLADGPAARTVAGRISDKDGGFYLTTTEITVNNVAPIVTSLASSNADLASK
jgi:hypothetical protein